MEVPMKAYWLNDHREISMERLREEGVDCDQLDPSGYQSALNVKAGANGYVTQDVVELSPTTPNLDTILAKFDKEHLHTDDEVRFVLDGRGIFDIRSKGDQWMRVEVHPFDYIAVPKDRHHRFFLMDDKRIKCVRLFKDSSGWTPHYRSETPVTAVL